jgi:hypothetical protein
MESLKSNLPSGDGLYNFRHSAERRGFVGNPRRNASVHIQGNILLTVPRHLIVKIIRPRQQFLNPKLNLSNQGKRVYEFLPGRIKRVNVHTGTSIISSSSSNQLGPIETEETSPVSTRDTDSISLHPIIYRLQAAKLSHSLRALDGCINTAKSWKPAITWLDSNLSQI